MISRGNSMSHNFQSLSGNMSRQSLSSLESNIGLIIKNPRGMLLQGI